MTTESIGKNAQDIVPSVFRIFNRASNEAGTGFLHKSGLVITAAHVVKSAQAAELAIRDFAGSEYKISKIIRDDSSDLALLEPSPKIVGPIPFELSERQHQVPGKPVEAWGYPGGYNGASAMLVGGHIAGVDEHVITDNKTVVVRLVVNAAFNQGNSGGPVLDVEVGKVIGVVTAKLTPIPPEILSALDALKKQNSGFSYVRTNSDGSKETIMEAQVVAMILEFLRSQTQLVVGHATRASDLRTFLVRNGLVP